VAYVILVPFELTPISPPISPPPGELIDKIAILEIKAERIQDPLKLNNIRAELAALVAARDHAIFDPAEIADMAAELRDVNESLGMIADRLRICEQSGDFGAEFVELSRSMYKTNDRRAVITRRINERLRSQVVEEKSYG
jgi:hypothetical protein